MDDPEGVVFRSPGQRPEENENPEQMEAGKSERVTKVDLRAIWPLWIWFGLGAVPRLHLGLWNCTLFAFAQEATADKSGCLRNVNGMI
jgi:hypothetical protein